MAVSDSTSFFMALHRKGASRKLLQRDESLERARGGRKLGSRIRDQRVSKVLVMLSITRTSLTVSIAGNVWNASMDGVRVRFLVRGLLPPFLSDSSQLLLSFFTFLLDVSGELFATKPRWIPTRSVNPYV